MFWCFATYTDRKTVDYATNDEHSDILRSADDNGANVPTQVSIVQPHYQSRNPYQKIEPIMMDLLRPNLSEM